MSATDRLTALDNSFLDLEDQSAHMHVAAVMVFEGEPPAYEELLEALERRLHLVPRYRQKLAFPPGRVGRPRWVDDPHLNLSYHVRATALPFPGNEDQLRALAGRVFSQQLDRDKPLWEMWLAGGLEPEPGGDGRRRFALLSKTHHALVDGVSGVDIASVLFDLDPEPPGPPTPPERWLPRPEPSGAQLLAEVVRERAGIPLALAREAATRLRRPDEVVGELREMLAGLGAILGARIDAAPPSPYNERIGSHRRFTWVRAVLDDVKAIKNALGGTVNDVVLATVAGGLRRHLERRGVDPRGLALKAMVPVSVRTEEQRGALGNRVTTMYARLPVGHSDPVDRLRFVSELMRDLKRSRQAVGAQTLVDLGGFAPPNLIAQATRQFASARLFNLTVTNVPGPQFPLYLLGRELLEMFPMVSLTAEHALGVAIMSYNGALNFGLVGDYDLMRDIDDLAADFEASLRELGEVAGVELTEPAEMRTTRA